MPASDPWFWTVDQVVAEVCNSDALYLAARVPTSNVPDGAELEKQLRMEQITGKRFLLLFDRPKIVVKNALSIAQLSQRMALADVIDLLRSRSYTYGQQEATAGVKSLDINRKHPLDLSVSGFPSNVTSRKRRKITPVSTAPLSKRPQATQTATPSTGPAPEDPSVNTNSWSHLLRWENDRDTDDIIDFAAEEELEEPEEEDEESHDSLDEEDEVPEQSSSRLTQEEVVNIINDRIEHYTTSWAPNKGVARGEEIDYDPVLMWEEAESSGQREAMVQRYEMEHAYYKQRLDTLCDEIVKSPGSNATQVRRQCSNLELTIQSMELAGWMKDIYQLPPVANSDEEHEPQPHDYPPVYPSQPGAFVEIIDLGSPSVSSGDEVVMPGDAADIRRRSSTPDSIITESVEPIIATHPELISAAIPVQHTDESQLASISTIRRCLLADLMWKDDRKRVVSKAISELRADDRELIRNRVQLIGNMASIREIAASVDMLWSGESKLRGVLPRDMPKILVFVNLFLSWWFCRDYLKGPKASKADLADLKLSIEDGSAKMDVFYDYVHTVMGTTFSEIALQHPERPSQAEIIEISDDDD